jgi:hypothetical protein
MAQTSYPFENVDTTENQFSQWADALALGSGVVNTGNKLEVTPLALNAGVQVASGKAVVRGHFYQSTDVESFNIPAAPATQWRKDFIVLELDPAANSIVLARVQGTPAATLEGAALPTLTQSETGVYQMPIAQVNVEGFVSSIIDYRRMMDGQYPTPLSTRSGNFTLSKANANKTIIVDPGTNHTVTIPANVFSAGDRIDFIFDGTAATTFAPAAGATLNSVDNKKRLTKRYAAATVFCKTPTDFYVIGNLDA